MKNFLTVSASLLILAAMQLSNGNSASESPNAFETPGWVFQDTTGPGFSVATFGIANQRLFACGSERRIATSLDATNWTLNYSNNSSIMWDLAFGNGLYVAVGFRGTLLTSPDLIQWTPINFGLGDLDPGFTAVVFAQNKFFAYASGGIWRSSDGLNWRIASKPNPVDYARVIRYANGLFVAAGDIFFIDRGGQAIIATSPDGLTWTERFRNDSVSGFSIVYANGTSVVPLGSIVTSSDGTNWIARTPLSTTPLQFAAFGKGIIIATSQGGTPVWTSTNATTWKKVEVLGGHNIGGLEFFNDRFVAGTATGEIQFLDPGASLRVGFAGKAQIELNGIPYFDYRIDSSEELSTDASFWASAIILRLTDTPVLWTDPTSSRNGKRYYRSVLLPGH